MLPKFCDAKPDPVPAEIHHVTRERGRRRWEDVACRILGRLDTDTQPAGDWLLDLGRNKGSVAGNVLRLEGQ